MKSIAAVCKRHRRRAYYEDGKGLIGVFNHRDVILWYRWTDGGYSLSGSTDTSEGAQLHYLT